MVVTGTPVTTIFVILISMEIPDIKKYNHYKTRKGYLGLDKEHPLARADYYENEEKDFSIGIYYFNNIKLWIAWGKKGSCSYHALLFTQTPIIGKGCISFTLEKSSIIFHENEKPYLFTF